MLSNANEAQVSCFAGGLFLGVSGATYGLSGLIGNGVMNSVLYYVALAAGLAIPATGDLPSCFRT
jgi:hypothetical protein